MARVQLSSRRGQLKFSFPVLDQSEGRGVNIEAKWGASRKNTSVLDHEVSVKASALIKKPVSIQIKTSSAQETQEDSIHFAAILAAISSYCAFHGMSVGKGAWVGRVWATGALRNAISTSSKSGVELREGMPFDEEKVAAFLSSPDQLFLIPDDFASQLEEPKPMKLAEFSTQVSRRDFWEKNQHVIVGVPMNGLTDLIDTLFGYDEISKLQKRTNWYIILSLILASVVIAITADRVWIRPLCVPVSWHCFIYGWHRFDSNEMGILVERQRIFPDVSIHHALRIFEAKLKEWSEFALEGSNNVIIRVVAVNNVTPNEISRSNATIGISGALDLATAPASGHRRYLFQDTRAWFNPTAIVSSKWLEPDGLYVRSVTEPLPISLHYTEPAFEFLPALANRDRNAILKHQFRTQFPSPVNMRILFTNEKIPEEFAAHSGVQNLNISIQSELNALGAPSRSLRDPVRLNIAEINAFDDFDSIFRGLVAMRSDISRINTTDEPPTILDHVVRAAQNHIPSSLFSFASIVDADAALLQIPINVSAMSSEKEGGPELIRWSGIAAKRYMRAANDARSICPKCGLIAAQLLWYQKSFTAWDVLLGEAKDSMATETDRRQALLLAWRLYEAISVDYNDPKQNPKDRFVELNQEVEKMAEQVRKLGGTTVADFEQARWLLTRGPDSKISEGVELLRRVLEHRPRHLLTRYLLVKIRAHRFQKWPENSDAELDGILHDIIASKNQYDESLHSLGEDDDIYHSVSATHVLEDLVVYFLSKCDGASLAHRIRMTTETSHQKNINIDWYRIAAVLHSKTPAIIWRIFPTLGDHIFYSSAPPRGCSESPHATGLAEMRRHKLIP